MKSVLLLFGTTKLGKVLWSGSTMLLSLAVYAGAWSWSFAAGFVALLFLHELGHFSGSEVASRTPNLYPLLLAAA